MDRRLLELSVENSLRLCRITVPLDRVAGAAYDVARDRVRAALLRDTGSLSDPKKILMQKVSGTNRRYRESDAPDVFAQAVTLGCVDRPNGSNRSWQQLRTDALDCCRTHIGPRGKTR
ncbi:hypothetical protein AB0M54_15770 [Actinoplanes sp. NPDC051470]|uniref:hypothetical protein n=1 Tax=Actinoplanes sp. NPDC051470 TaxID=3157224 RepID=UPI0034219123